MYQAVLFDMDGVLLDTERNSYRIWQTYFRERFQYELEESFYAELAGSATSVFHERMETLPGGDAPLTAYWIEQVNAQIERGETPKMPGFDALAAYLKTFPGYKAIVTSSEGAWLQRYADSCGFYGIFDRIFTGKLVKNKKPAPDCYLLACRELGVAPEDCLVVEDSYWGVLAAQRAGASVLHMEGMPKLPEDIREKCVGHVEDLHGVVAFLQEKGGDL